MAVLPKYKRIRKEDFEPQQQEFVDKLAFAINDGFSALYNAVSGKLTFGDNILSSIRTLNVTVNAAGTPTTLTSTRLPSNISNPQGVLVLSAVNTQNSSVYATATPFISFSTSAGNLIVNNIAGLPAGNSFELKILIIG